MRTMPEKLASIALIVLLFALPTACSAPAGPQAAADTPAGPAPTHTSLPAVAEPAAKAEAPATATPLPLPAATAPPESTAPPAQDPPATAASAAPEALSPVEALVASFDRPAEAGGDLVVLVGQVLDRSGAPIPGAAVEIWQTDANGVYDHPGDASTANRDRSFQFYGTSVSDGAGYYAFRTIQPGYYEPRPRHIHVKVRIDGAPVLTTQFYFADEQAGVQSDLLLLALQPATDGAGRAVDVARRDLVLDRGSGTLAPTPAQMEGPYYPVVRVADYDNDLAVVP